MDNFLKRDYEPGVRRKRRLGVIPWLRTHGWLMIFPALLLSGCVRLTGTAGYWKTDKQGNPDTKRATFDSADFFPGSPAPGSIDY